MKGQLDELLSHCIRCGFCLESCPTFVVTSDETESPRGRIYLIRSAIDGQLDWQQDVKPHLDLCLGCRACEPACPSGVQYGLILEIARNSIDEKRLSISKKMILESTTNIKILRTQLALARLTGIKKLPFPISEVVSNQPQEAELPTPQRNWQLPPLAEKDLPPIRGSVYLLQGCAMSVLYARVHECSRRLLRRIGFKVVDVEQGCCGAMHAHNGDLSKAEILAKKLVGNLPEPFPVLVDSAGCGSTMKAYGSLLDESPEAKSFAQRTYDIAEFLHLRGLTEQLSVSKGLATKVAYHEACHLVHGQRISAAPKELLASVPQVTMASLMEAEMCCGSAGIYNVLQPKMARSLLTRKWQNVEECMPDVVVTGNPGCHAWLAQAAREHGRRIPVVHTVEFLERSFCEFDL